MKYDPQVNDYVIWKNKYVEGWVYFKDHSYITIEQFTRLKDDQNYQACSLHRKERVLVVCHSWYWSELNYIKSRQSIYEEETVQTLENLGKSTGTKSI